MYSSCYYLKWTLSRALSRVRGHCSLKVRQRLSSRCIVLAIVALAWTYFVRSTYAYVVIETSVKPCVWALHLWMLESTWQRRIFTAVYFPVTRSMCEDIIIKLYLTLSNLAHIKKNKLHNLPIQIQEKKREVTEELQHHGQYPTHTAPMIRQEFSICHMP